MRPLWCVGTTRDGQRLRMHACVSYGYGHESVMGVQLKLLCHGYGLVHVCHRLCISALGVIRDH